MEERLNYIRYSFLDTPHTGSDVGRDAEMCTLSSYSWAGGMEPVIF